MSKQKRQPNYCDIAPSSLRASSLRRALAILGLTGIGIAGLGLGACVIDEEDARRPDIAKSQEALIGGTVDTEDPAVVALTFGGPTSFCTGTLVSPTVILTAAHCIDDLSSDPNAAIFFGADIASSSGKVEVRTKHQHPLWTGDLSGEHDIGMLVMNFSSDVTPLPLNTTSPISNHIGADYRHVGFGIYDRDTQSADGKKRTGTDTITGTRGDVIISGDADLSICFGDSGGPAFLTVDDQEIVAGVHSFLTGNCMAPNGDTNVHTYADDFILPWIQDNDPACGLDGICGAIGCLDDPDCQPCGPDGTCVADCALPDPDCTTQAIGDICRADSQCISDTCAAYRPDPAYSFCTELCDPSNDTCPDRMSCQEILPFGNICYYDKDPDGVLGDSCDTGAQCGSYNCTDSVCVIPCDLSVGLRCPDNFECATHNDADYFCFELPKEDGGCSIGGTRSSGFALFLLGICLLGLRRRRRR